MNPPLADRVKEARAATGLTQTELAQLAGIGLTALRNIEQGITTDPRVSTYDALMKALATASMHEPGSSTAGNGRGRNGSETHESPTTESPQIQQAAGLR
ncbi:MAG: helix-turn-helix transcriptional regulator [Actinobacteria bacterium]|nr:helix-turn-helix transcriptional regulator [Actinomycetota bacterium]